MDRMRDDADSHAEEDKRKRQLAEIRNQADSMCWQLEKLLKEHDAKLVAADKEAVNKAMEKTRTAAKGEDIETIKAAVHELEQASHALSRTLYASTAPSRARAVRPTAPARADRPTQRRRQRRRRWGG